MRFTVIEAIEEAKAKGVDILTTYDAFVGFDDLEEFLQQASETGVAVTFAPTKEQIDANS